jgi:hypothetical protein
LTAVNNTVAVCSRPTLVTLALIAIDEILTDSILAWVTGAFIDVDFTVCTSPSRLTCTLVTVYIIFTFTIDAGV